MPLSDAQFIEFKNNLQPELFLDGNKTIDLEDFDKKLDQMSLQQKYELALFTQGFIYPKKIDLEIRILEMITEEFKQRVKLEHDLDLEELYIYSSACFILLQTPKKDVKTRKEMQKAAETKRIGHVLGLSGKASVKFEAGTKTTELETEGSQYSRGIDYITEKLRNYHPPGKSLSLWEKIHNMFMFSHGENAKVLLALFSIRIDKLELAKIVQKGQLNDMLDNAAVSAISTMSRSQLNRYVDEEPCLIDTGWSGHGISVVLYKGYMIVSNRGEGMDPRGGTLIYKLSPQITQMKLQEYLNKLNMGGINLQSSLSKSKILELLQIMSSDKEPLLAFPQKTQEHGTCGYANKKAAIEGLLCLFNLENQGKLTDDNIRKYPVDYPYRVDYKEFTKYTADSEIERILEKVRIAERRNDKDEIAFLINLAFTVVLEHPGKYTLNAIKAREEIERADKLMQIIKKHRLVLTNENNTLFIKLNDQLNRKKAYLNSLKTKTPNDQERAVLEKLIREASSKTIIKDITEIFKQHSVSLYHHGMPVDVENLIRFIGDFNPTDSFKNKNLLKQRAGYIPEAYGLRQKILHAGCEFSIEKAKTLAEMTTIIQSYCFVIGNSKGQQISEQMVKGETILESEFSPPFSRLNERIKELTKPPTTSDTKEAKKDKKIPPPLPSREAHNKPKIIAVHTPKPSNGLQSKTKPLHTYQKILVRNLSQKGTTKHVGGKEAQEPGKPMKPRTKT